MMAIVANTILLLLLLLLLSQFSCVRPCATPETAALYYIIEIC